VQIVLVVVAGAELFTGNNLLVMAWADRRITLAELLRTLDRTALLDMANKARAVAKPDATQAVADECMRLAA
jgi:UDP-N-acetylglucosamine:LPS N-acetylglucosamine transferase